MSINFIPKSTLGYGVAITLVAYFGGTYLGRPSLVKTAKPFLILFVGVWLIFVSLSIVRNVKSGF